jgi:rubrerythrin
VTIELFKEKGIALDEQSFTWRDVVRTPISKLDNDAFTRVRIILMNGIESEQNRFLHALARMNGDLQRDAARIRRVEQHQQTLVNWLNPPDQSVLETTIGFEQVAIEVTASVAQVEPDPYLAQVYRFGLLEDFDHMYRYSALMDRVEGKDANAILQSYTDVLPGRPTAREHRHPDDDLRKPYDRTKAFPLSKLNAITIMAGENQTHDYYMTVGPMFADPVARQLYAEIASIEEQHVTQYESIIDPNETWLEKWLMHECNEVYNYWSCSQFEDDPRIKKVWDRFVEYELGHLHHVMRLFEKIEKRDPAEVVPQTLPAPIQYVSQREFVREVLAKEVDYTANGKEIGAFEDTKSTLAYREQMNSEGSPSEQVAADYHWTPGTELNTPAAAE